MTLKLRPYQDAAIDALRAGLRAGHKRQMLCMPTGSGKTAVAAALIKAADNKGSKVTFIADRITLVEQTAQRLMEAGVVPGIVQAQNTAGRNLPIQVCSAQSIEKRGFIADLDMLFIDEAHAQRTTITNFALALDKPVIGLSATPMTKGLGKVYTNIVNGSTTDDLIREGWLVPLRVYCSTPIDTNGLPVTAGEWSDRAVSSRVMSIVGDIVSDWVEYVYRVFGGPVQTLVFSSTVDDGWELCRQFWQLGYRFEQVSYRDKDDERRSKISRFRSGEITGLVSVEALARGFDVPQVQCLISARPYRSSVAAHIQQLGRGQRPASGKDFCLVLDHAGNYIRHAWATEAFWAQGVSELDAGEARKAARASEPESVEAAEAPERRCRSCNLVMPIGAELCPGCGMPAPVRRKARSTMVKPGRMLSYDDLREELDDIWPSLSRICLDKARGDVRKAIKMARAQFKEITGRWPDYRRELEPCAEAHPDLLNIVNRNRQRFYARQNILRRKGYR